MRRTEYNGQTKSVVASATQTLVWTNSEIASERVVAYHLVFDDQNGVDLSLVDRIRVSANGSNIINITPLQLRSYWQSFSKGKIQLGAAANAFTIPFCLLDAPTPDQQDVSQFPANSQVEVNIQLTTGVGETGSVFMGWTETNIAPTIFPRILASSMNIPASVALQRFNFQENGVVRGLGITHTGIDRCKFALANDEYTELPGPRFQGAAAAIGDMLLEAESLYGNGISSAGTPLTTNAFSRISAGKSAPVDGSYVELQTAAAWPGVGEEIVVYAVAPNQVAVQQAAA